eukprot:scaffold411383_cov14-Prasinocladus_malaysianus.AAC.1
MGTAASAPSLTPCNVTHTNRKHPWLAQEVAGGAIPNGGSPHVRLHALKCGPCRRCRVRMQ